MEISNKPLRLGKNQKSAILLMRDGTLLYEKYRTDPIYYMLGGKQIPKSLFESLDKRGFLLKLKNPERHTCTYTLSELGESAYIL